MKSEIGKRKSKSEFGVGIRKSEFRMQRFRNSELEFGNLSYEFEIRFHVYIRKLFQLSTYINKRKCRYGDSIKKCFLIKRGGS